MGNFILFCRITIARFCCVNLYLLYYTEEKYMLDFVLCDDNFNALTRLEKMLESLFIECKINARIALSTTNPEELIEYVKVNKVNVVFLDIDLKSNITGLDLADIIRKKDRNIYIIFTTGHLEYGLMAYKYKTF